MLHIFVDFHWCARGIIKTKFKNLLLHRISAGEPLTAAMNILQEREAEHVILKTIPRVWNPGEMYWEVQNYLSVKRSKFKGVWQNGWGWKKLLEDILSNPLLKQGHLEQGAQNHVQTASECLQGQRSQPPWATCASASQ